jgi:3-oxoacyl-[acyl-carrier protein] reductase
MTDQDLSGRVALVTGASGGIGAAISRVLARAGATVALGYGRNRERAEQLASELGGGAAAFGADMEDPAAPARLVAEIGERLGPVDLLVVNHGLGKVAAWEDLDVEGFDRTIAINLRAPFLLAQAAVPGMLERGYGRVLFIGSLAGFRGGVVGPDYAASKAGLHGLTHFLASRVASGGVTVNVIAPGFVETEMLPGDPAELGKTMPVGRVGRPEEVADLALAVMTNAFITSKVFPIDGGAYPH